MRTAALWPAPVRHGGPDAHGIVRFDFSTNGNATGPLSSVARAVARADRARYPDPAYRALREQLAAWHRVDAERIVVAGSGSELIHRLTHVAAVAAGVRRAVLPSPGYGDYAAAAALAGLATAFRPTEIGIRGWRADGEAASLDAVHDPVPAAGDLCWITEPMNPTGSTLGRTLATAVTSAVDAGAIPVLDLAYQPLRLDDPALAPQVDMAWQLWSPNKACGLTGIRAAYAIAPRGSTTLVQALRAYAPSWVVGADGVAMLSAFATPAAHDELGLRLRRLRAWRDALATTLRGAGWRVHDSRSVAPFFVAQAPTGIDVPALRARSIKLRCTDDMGLPGWLRLSAQPPAAVRALRDAFRGCAAERPR